MLYFLWSLTDLQKPLSVPGFLKEYSLLYKSETPYDLVVDLVIVINLSLVCKNDILHNHQFDFSKLELYKHPQAYRHEVPIPS